MKNLFARTWNIFNKNKTGVFLRFWLLLIISFLLFNAAPVLAQDQPPTTDDVNRVASKLYCPVCENEPLDVCRTAACVQWKAQISQFLAEGRSEEEIMQTFVDRFGLRVLAEPPAAGASLMLWVAPILAVIFGALYAVRVLRRMLMRGALASSEPSTTAAGGDDDYIDQVEHELKQRF